MSNSNSSRSYARGLPVRTDTRRRQVKQGAEKFRADLHIERPVSIHPKNDPLNNWLIEFTRTNRALKDTRNLGGLSLTIIESEDLHIALSRRYKDYGTQKGKTQNIQRHFVRNFGEYILEQQPELLWEQEESMTEVRVEGRLRTLGSSRRPSLCLMLASDMLYEEHAQIMDYLRHEENLRMPTSQTTFLPHITVVKATANLINGAKIPDHPRNIQLDAPGAIASVSKI